jgi:hypothetical protein
MWKYGKESYANRHRSHPNPRYRDGTSRAAFVNTWEFYLLGWSELAVNPYVAFCMTPENLYHLELGADK